MNNIKTVSIWIGLMDSVEELKKYLLKFSDDEGEFIDSEFEKDFNIQFDNQDIKEINFLEKPTKSFSTMVSRHSHGESIISNYMEKFHDDLEKNYNFIILVYEFKYMGLVKKVDNNDKFVRFIGNFEYDSIDG